MDKFLNYFEDKKFVRWVLYPDNQLDTFWREYLEANPSEKDQLELARLLLLQLQSKKESAISDTATVDLYPEIVAQIEQKQKRYKVRRFALAFARYAAVGLLFFSLGIAYYYFQSPGQLERLSEQAVMLQGNEHAQLILGSGENVSINEKESTVEYQANGKIIINSQDTVQSNAESSAKQELNHLIVPYGNSSSVKLPDGTIAYLNAGSRLVYPNFFKGKSREVFLIGEGFFEVAHNDEMSFIVQTNDLSVEALGTKFNLSAYPSDNRVETVLVDGKVKLREKGFQPLKRDYILEPDQLAVFDRASTEINISEVDVLNYVSWHEGFLNFESAELNRIAKKLERYYNINIMLSDPMLGIRTISGKLKLKDEKERALMVLATTASVELVKLNERTYVLR
nr:FecR domain-containing protein [Sunxiuqinia sp.]